MANWVLGLTGGIGSGKTAASDYLASLGISIVDADIVAREVVEPGKPALQAIEQHFGTDVLNSDGTLNRSWLRQQVFQYPEQRKALEAITHPAIRETIIEQLQQADSAYAVLASPLLFESSQHLLCQRTLVIEVPEQLQLQRASARDSNSEEQIKRIIAAQMPRQQRLQSADDVVDNSASLETLYRQLQPLHQRYLQLASTTN